MHLLNEIQKIRAKNNSLWMNLARLAWEVAPKRARAISREINRNDEKILLIAKELAR